MDRVIVARKLDSLQRCLRRVEDKRPADLQALLDDVDLQDVLVLNLSRAVQICVDLAVHLLAGTGAAPPASMGEAFERLAQAGVLDAVLATHMRQAVGFRNIAVHAYDSIDWRVVHVIAGERLRDFRAFAAAVVQRLEG